MSIQLYTQYRRALKTAPFSADYADYDWYSLPKTMHMSLMAYGTMLREFSAEIANDINALINYTHRLAAWDEVMRPLSDQRRLHVLVEFVLPIATLALGMPYAVRSRFIFAAAHLAHQANQVLDGSQWVDDLPSDDDIQFCDADRCGTRWKRYKGFKRALERFSAKDFQLASKNFRNKYNHQIAPGIGLGLTGMVTRKPDPMTGKVLYVFGETQPLALGTVVKLLSEQCVRGRKAFDQFKALVEEQQAIIQASALVP